MKNEKLRIKKQEEHITKTFRMPKSIIERMDIIAAERNISLNKLMILFAEYALENLDDE